MVILYLAAVVAANVTVAVTGPWATVPVAAVMIGCTLTVRDRLHERWLGRGLRPRMASLIVTAGALSWLASPDAGRIAVASGVAFAISELVDSLVYHRLLRRPWAHRANWSNTAGALADSLAFPALAFGAWLPWIVLGQWVAKVAGGAAWVWLLRQRRAQCASI